MSIPSSILYLTGDGLDHSVDHYIPIRDRYNYVPITKFEMTAADGSFLFSVPHLTYGLLREYVLDHSAKFKQNRAGMSELLRMNEFQDRHRPSFGVLHHQVNRIVYSTMMHSYRKSSILSNLLVNAHVKISLPYRKFGWANPTAVLEFLPEAEQSVRMRSTS